MRLRPFSFLVQGLAVVGLSASLIAAKPQTEVSIEGDAFQINGHPTYEGRVWNGHKVEGLLMNSRMVQGVFDDRNPETVSRWVYPDTGKWDPDRNTDEFIAAMPEWKRHGMLAFTINLQGGSPYGYSSEQPWNNSAYDEDGSLRPDYAARLARILNRADELGMVPIVGYFYFGQDQRLKDEQAVLEATDSVTNWLLDHGWRNVLVEINNECNMGYDHDILKPERVHELIERVQGAQKNGRRLLVGTSYTGGRIPDESVVRVSDFLLLHANGVSDAQGIVKMARATRAVPGYTPKPIVFNEDDHYDFDREDCNLAAAVAEYTSWGFFDFRRENEPFTDGYQSVPVDWRISSARKKAFFQLLGEITGADGGRAARAWVPVPMQGTFHAREECAFVACGDRFYLLGGRGINPVDIFDPQTGTWSEGAPPPLEIHHFQPVVWQGKIYVASAMTGGFPTEKAIDRILIYDPAKDVWTDGPKIPKEMQRGSAGAVIRDGRLYLVSGIINGHTDGWVKSFTSYDFQTGQWAELPEAPHARDHFEAGLVGDKIYAAGGRRSSAVTGQVFDLVVPEVDVYDFATKKWSTLPASSNLPVPRAGGATVVAGKNLIVIGGESMAQEQAHGEVDLLDTKTGQWHSLPPLLEGRHGTTVILRGGALYTCAGCGKRGGEPLLSSMEMLK